MAIFKHSCHMGHFKQPSFCNGYMMKPQKLVNHTLPKLFFALWQVKIVIK
jgi:hypothetical protein